MAKNRQVSLVQPGEILNEEFLRPLNITRKALAVALRTRLSMTPAASVPIPHCGWRGTLARVLSFGLISRGTTTCRWQRNSFFGRLRNRFRPRDTAA
jgi:hypothetical protein